MFGEMAVAYLALKALQRADWVTPLATFNFTLSLELVFSKILVASKENRKATPLEL